MLRGVRRTAAAIAVAAAGVGATAAYVVQRCVERSRGAVIDPRLVIVEYHTAYYWRAANAMWWGALVGVVAYAVALRRPEATVRVLAVAAPLCAAFAVVLSWLLP